MTTNWSEILEIPPNELDYDSVEFVRNNLPLIDANALNSDELRKYFALSCFLIRNSTSDKGLKWDGNGRFSGYSRNIAEKFLNHFFSVKFFFLKFLTIFCY